MRIFILILLGLSLSTSVQAAASVPQVTQEKISQEKVLPEKVASHPQKKEEESSKSKPPLCNPNVTSKMPETFY
jgi:hypothetical protein